MDVKSVVNHKF